MRKIINYTAVESRRQAAQEIVCKVAYISAAAMACGLLAGGIILPLLAQDAGPVTCWSAMVMEAAAYGCCKLAAWVRREAMQ